MSKNFFKSFISTLLALMMIVSAAAVPSSAASVKLNKTSISLTKGYSTTLKVSGTASTVKWSTGNKNVATVSSKGKVIGKKVGSTYIYAKVDSLTLKCKVNVVAGKIAVAKSSTELEPGETEKIRIKAIGTHSLSASTSDKSVVQATWSGAKFKGDYIDLTLKAVAPGTARIKVYAKKYPKTIYKYITVEVIGDDDTIDDDDIFDDDDDDDDDSDTVRLQSSVSSLNVAEGNSETFMVYAPSTVLPYLAVESSSVLGYGIKRTIDNSRNALVITVTGYSAGSGTIKVYSYNNSRISVTIPINVTSSLQYYKLTNVKPANKILPTDTIIAFQSGTVVYYMLVPYGYDPAYANSIAAKGVNSYSYNLVYDTMPQKKMTSDQIVTKNVVFNGTSQTRYVLAPYGYDPAFVETIFAKYSGKFEYYTVYTERPTSNVFTDEVLSWTISKSDPATGRTENVFRYILVPMGYDSNKVSEIKNKDTTTSIGALTYTVYSTLPVVDSYNFKVIQWVKGNNENRYMVIPSVGCDYVKRNDIVRKDVGYFSYYVAYSEKPTVTSTATEAVYTITLQDPEGKLRDVYVLYNPKDSDYQKKIEASLNGNSAYVGVRQGTIK